MSGDGARHIDEWLARNPDARFWALGYGTNDAAGDAGDPSRFKANLQTIIDRVRAAGRVPILATIPFASDGHHRGDVQIGRNQCAQGRGQTVTAAECDDLRHSRPRSRCCAATTTRRSRRRFANSSAIATLRCLPPVQPTATVR